MRYFLLGAMVVCAGRLRAAEATPSITGLSPASVAPGGAAFNLQITGDDLTAQTVVLWNGQSRPTTFLDSQSISAQIGASDIATPGLAIIKVSAPSGVSRELVFQIAQPPVTGPLMGSVSPGWAAPGSGAFTLVVSGANFTSQSVVRWNGADRATTRISAARLEAAISAPDVAAAGTALVRVYDPVAGSSGNWLFPIATSAPAAGGAPSVGSLSPSTVQAGSGSFVLSVVGGNFGPQHAVKVNGQFRPTTYGGPMLLEAVIPAGDVAAAGTLTVAVGSASASLTVTPAPVPPPGTPSSPSPSDGAVDVSRTPALSWLAASNATSYDVYFGTSSSPPLVANVTGTGYTPGLLEWSTVYYWRVTARNGSGTAASPVWRFTTLANTVIPNPTVGGYRFVPVTPCRVVDTRSGQGTSGSFGPPAMAAGTPREFPIPAGRCGIPGSAKAYSLNVTVVPLEPLSYVSIWPAGQAQPTVSTLNSLHGGIVANAAIVPAGTNGSIYVLATNRTELIVDINGYFEASGTYSFYTVDPCRVVDTRAGAGLTGSFGPPALVGSVTRDLPLLAGRCGIANAAAYSLNVTVVPPEPLAYLTLWPTGGAKPLVSTLNALDGAVVANAAIVPAGMGGNVSAYATQGTELVVDVNGYFAAPGFANPLLFYPVTPCRVVDTRVVGAGAPIVAGQQKRDFAIAGQCGVPVGAKAFSLNATVVPGSVLAYLTLWPAGKAQPLVSTLNSFLGRIVANAALVPAGTGGAVSVYATNDTHVILDVNGYFQ